ncbi:DUF6268 family outer membrane beta-barrel protein [Dyadobacter bucti]|uniref:DUF6268 family outer membrane beta-barrel protein n=1 Tax=Dyadobacter bucti TaxID=2572203 RepID=UPI001108F7CE|nr:DUF6268 family outer membrane beta-barrel protein [Dyadobacter bucti]
MRFIINLVFFLGTCNVWAQDFKLAGVEYFTYPKVQAKDVGNQHQASFQEFGAYVFYPRKLKNDQTIIMNGIQYGFVQATSYNKKLSSQNTQDFHKIAYTFILIHKFNEQWTLSGRLSPTLASDFKDNLSGHDFILQGSIIASKRFNERVIAGAGLVYTTRLGKPMFLPGLQYQYKKCKHNLNVFIPAFFNYTYQVDSKEKLKVGFRIGLNGANFNASVNNYSKPAELDRLNYARANIGPVISYQLTRMIQIEAFGGISTMRMYQFEDTDKNIYKYNSKSGGFFNIGLGITPPKRKLK